MLRNELLWFSRNGFVEFYTHSILEILVESKVKHNFKPHFYPLTLNRQEGGRLAPPPVFFVHALSHFWHYHREILWILMNSNLKEFSIFVNFFFNLEGMVFFWLNFLGIFSSLAPKLLKLMVNFFLWAGHEKLGYEHAFQPYTYSLRTFMGRGGGCPPCYT